MNQLLDALDTAMAWELPDEYLSFVLNNQVGLLSGDDPEETWQAHSDSHFPPQH